MLVVVGWRLLSELRSEAVVCTEKHVVRGTDCALTTPLLPALNITRQAQSCRGRGSSTGAKERLGDCRSPGAGARSVGAVAGALLLMCGAALDKLDLLSLKSHPPCPGSRSDGFHRGATNGQGRWRARRGRRAASGRLAQPRPPGQARAAGEKAGLERANRFSALR